MVAQNAAELIERTFENMKLQKILASVILMLTLITTAIPAIGATASSSLPVEEAPLTDEPERGAGWTADGNVVYASASVNVRTGPGTGYDVVGKLAKGDAVRRIAYNDKWSKIAYKGHVRYISYKYVTLAYPYSSDRFPLRYYDLTSTVTVYKEKYAETWCICAHIEYTRFDRFCGELALGAWSGPGGGETTETLIHFACRKDAILAVNGDNNRTVGGIGKNSVLYKDDSTFCEIGKEIIESSFLVRRDDLNTSILIHSIFHPLTRCV